MKLIKPSDKRLTYSGRIDFDDPERPVFCYCGTSVSCRFFGTEVFAYISNTENDWRDFLGYIIDGKQYCLELDRDGQTHRLLLAQGLHSTWHDLVLFKRQDQCHYFKFEGLETDGDIEKVVRPERRIEVIGDSISCGEVVEANEFAGKPDPEHRGEYSNAYYSYGWQLARMLDAEIHITSESGIALLDNTGYFNEPGDSGAQGMESCFECIEFNRNFHVFKKWDFDRYIPHVVIVALGQNDAHPEDYMRRDYNCEKAVTWRKSYRAFVEKLMSLYPKAHIILATTILNHDKSWDEAIDEVCRSISSDRVTHFLYSRNGNATPGHVRIAESEEMASELYRYINDCLHVWK